MDNNIPPDLMDKLNKASEKAKVDMNRRELETESEYPEMRRRRRRERELLNDLKSRDSDMNEEFDAFNMEDSSNEEEERRVPRRIKYDDYPDVDSEIREMEINESPMPNENNLKRDNSRNSRDLMDSLSKNNDLSKDFLSDGDEDEGNRSPMSIDRPSTPRRRPSMDDEDDEDYIPRKRKKNLDSSFLSNLNLKPKYVAVIVGVIAFFVIGSILDKKQKNSDSDLMKTLNSNSSVELTETSEKDNQQDTSNNYTQSTYVDVGETTVDRGTIYNDTTISYSKELYEDEIAVSKFLEFRGASCIPKFMGYSEVLEREIEFQVSPDDYNRYLNGVKINIVYRALEKDGITYVTDIKIRQ